MEEEFQKKLIIIENQVKKMKKDHGEEMKNLQVDAGQQLNEYKDIYEKEKQVIEARLQKALNDIKKYQSHIEQNSQQNINELEEKHLNEITRLREEMDNLCKIIQEKDLNVFFYFFSIFLDE